MSTFGKILAFLNILGALALGALSLMEYSRRQAWAYSLFRHDLVLNGLPLDDKQQDPRGNLVADLIGEETKKDLFSSVGGNPVTTQVAEVERLHKQLADKIQGTPDKKQQIVLYSRILLNLVESNLERERLMACRPYLADDKTTAELKTRLQAAFNRAVRPTEAEVTGRKSFESLFREAIREQGGDTLEPFSTLFVKSVPEEVEKAKGIKFDEVFDKVLEEELAVLKKRYDEFFDEALTGKQVIQGTGKDALTGDSRRLAVARLLFVLCPFLAEEAQGKPADGGAAAQALLNSPEYQNAYKRMLTVVGVRAGLDALTEQARIMQRITGEAAHELIADRMAFAAAHGRVLERVRAKAAQVDDETALLARQRELIDDLMKEPQGVLPRRRLEVKSYEKELADSRAETAAQIKKLEGMSQKLFDYRVLLQKTEEENVKGYRDLVELEKQIKQLEGSSPSGRAGRK